MQKTKYKVDERFSSFEILKKGIQFLTSLNAFSSLKIGVLLSFFKFLFILKRDQNIPSIRNDTVYTVHLNQKFLSKQ